MKKKPNSIKKFQYNGPDLPNIEYEPDSLLTSWESIGPFRKPIKMIERESGLSNSTITVDGHIKIGPTAIPAFWRENYTGMDGFKLDEFLEIACTELGLLISNKFGFRQLAMREIRKYSRYHLVRLASDMVEGIDKNQFKHWGTPGIRAQLINTRTNQLVMDFCHEGDEKSFHVLNAVSPAFTCAMPFSRLLVDEIERLNQQ